MSNPSLSGVKVKKNIPIGNWKRAGAPNIVVRRFLLEHLN
jgi:hypothetical protein